MIKEVRKSAAHSRSIYDTRGSAQGDDERSALHDNVIIRRTIANDDDDDDD